MRIRAATVREIDSLAIEEIELSAPTADEVLVRIKAAGVCHSDLHTYKGELRTVPPVVLGHEGAGEVIETGANVTKVKPGDRVLVNWLPSCNHCPTCLSGLPTLCERFPSTTFQSLMPDGGTHHKTLDGMVLKPYLSSATMAEYAVIHEDGIVPIGPEIPYDVAAVAGCAIMTGAGAVFNTAAVPTGSSAVVIGCGGVGLSALLACRLAGCNPLIAVDVMQSKLEMAVELGATHTVNARETDAVQALRDLTGKGPDYAFDSVGSPITIAQALNSVRPGGTAVVMGLHAAKIDVPIPAGALVMANKRLLGSFAGSSRPLVDLPHLLELYSAGKMPIDKLITKHYALDELPQAFDDMETGKIARGVISFE